MWQVTGFTLAHSATLALGIYGVVRISPAIVEPLIAASIVFVAVENLFTDRLQRWRPLVVFGFGFCTDWVSPECSPSSDCRPEISSRP